MQDRLDRTPHAMRIRRQTVEHTFGTFKAWMEATHFLTKTLPRASTEMSLHVLAYNLKRVMKIIGIQPLVHAMRGTGAYPPPFCCTRELLVNNRRQLIAQISSSAFFTPLKLLFSHSLDFSRLTHRTIPCLSLPQNSAQAEIAIAPEHGGHKAPSCGFVGRTGEGDFGRAVQKFPDVLDGLSPAPVSSLDTFLSITMSG